MLSKSTSAAPKEIIKHARKQGRRDGRNQVPRQDWGADSVPFLTQLHRQYVAYGRELDLRLDQKIMAQESLKIEALRNEIQNKGEACAQRNALVRAEERFSRLQEKLDGSNDEVPMAKFARMRLISNAFYLPFLFVLFLGEFTITAPAFRVLLGEKTGAALIVTFTVSFLSVGAAHILGIFLKSKFDRSRPKSFLFNAIFVVVALFLVSTIIFLSNIRGRNSVLTSGNLTGMSESAKLIYLWAFYSFLQLTFVTVGTAISFMHYSEIESSVLRAKRVVWFLRRRQARSERQDTKSGTSVEEAEIDVSRMMDLEVEVLESKKILLRAQYEEVSAAYIDSNIHSRRDEMNGAHSSLQPLELDFHSLHIQVVRPEMVSA